MKSTLERQQDNSLKFTITIPWTDIHNTWAEVVKSATETAKMPGFRKGKAPQKMVEENLNKDTIKEEVLRKLLPQAYIKAVQEHNVRPIMNPKIHVDKLEDEKDWEVTAITCEMPEVDLGKYKDNVKSVTAKSKIVVPGKEQKEPSFDEIMKALMEAVEIKIPQILVEQEADRLLAQLLDEVRRLGLTLEQYLGSTNRKPESLREEYMTRAANDIKLEFALQKVAETENITVEPKEIDEAFQKAKSPEERAHLESNKYLLTSILRQQKTLDYLKSL